MQRTRYRPDIDGLRAFAILGVLLYHLFPRRFPLGYLGVDVFFVLSGFLITRKLLDEPAGKVRLRHFYLGRARRLFPALFVVLTCSLTFGWYVLLDNEYRELASHAAGGAGFFANFVAWKSSGYFERAVDLKPLFHLWSLGVEEQFYLVWPLLLGAVPGGARRSLWPIAVGGAASFALHCLLSRSHPEAAFFLPVARAWELGLGVVVACGKVSVSEEIDANPHLAWFGALLFCATFFFPASSWLPTTGTAMLLYAGKESWIARRILSARWLVALGGISYPLYLWHWPVLSFARILSPAELSTVGLLALGGLSVVLAALTHLFIERPVHSGSRSLGRVAAFGAAGMLGVGGFAGAIANGKFQSPLQKKFVGLVEAQQPSGYYPNKDCLSGHRSPRVLESNGCFDLEFPRGQTVMLFGDSHAGALSVGLWPYLKKRGINLTQLTASHCIPGQLEDQNERCIEVSQMALRKVAEIKPDVLVVFIHFGNYAETVRPGGNDFGEFLKRKLDAFSALGARQIILLGQIPVWTSELPGLLARHFVKAHRPIPEWTSLGLHPRVFEWDRRERSLAYENNVTYVSLTDALCDPRGCRTLVAQSHGSTPIVFDSGHLSAVGASFVTHTVLAPALHSALTSARRQN